MCGTLPVLAFGGFRAGGSGFRVGGIRQTVGIPRKLSLADDAYVDNAAHGASPRSLATASGLQRASAKVSSVLVASHIGTRIGSMLAYACIYIIYIHIYIYTYICKPKS